MSVGVMEDYKLRELPPKHTWRKGSLKKSGLSLREKKKGKRRNQNADEVRDSSRILCRPVKREHSEVQVLPRKQF
jgi:hypothetical protein